MWFEFEFSARVRGFKSSRPHQLPIRPLAVGESLAVFERTFPFVRVEPSIRTIILRIIPYFCGERHDGGYPGKFITGFLVEVVVSCFEVEFNFVVYRSDLAPQESLLHGQVHHQLHRRKAVPFLEVERLHDAGIVGFLLGYVHLRTSSFCGWLVEYFILSLPGLRRTSTNYALRKWHRTCDDWTEPFRDRFWNSSPLPHISCAISRIVRKLLCVKGEKKRCFLTFPRQALAAWMDYLVYNCFQSTSEAPGNRDDKCARLSARIEVIVWLFQVQSMKYWAGTSDKGTEHVTYRKGISDKVRHELHVR